MDTSLAAVLLQPTGKSYQSCVFSCLFERKKTCLFYIRKSPHFDGWSFSCCTVEYLCSGNFATYLLFCSGISLYSLSLVGKKNYLLLLLAEETSAEVEFFATVAIFSFPSFYIQTCLGIRHHHTVLEKFGGFRCMRLMMLVLYCICKACVKNIFVRVLHYRHQLTFLTVYTFCHHHKKI